MNRIRNIRKNSSAEKPYLPGELDLPGKSWLGYYRLQRGHSQDAEYICSVHNCYAAGIHGGQVELYINVKNYYFSRGYGIIPLCRKHDAQKNKMRSNVNDIKCFDGSDDMLVLIKPNNVFVYLPYHVIKYLKTS